MGGCSAGTARVRTLSHRELHPDPSGTCNSNSGVDRRGVSQVMWTCACVQPHLQMDVLSQLYFERLAKRAVMVAWKPAVEGILLLPRRPCSDSRMAAEASCRTRQGNMNS